jgi:methanogenic corrinoid protein MtbC1
VLRHCLSGGVAAEDVHWLVIAPALELVGAAWELGLISVAEEHLATAAAERALATLYPHLVREPRGPRGRVILAAAEGERHVLGLRMVADVLEGAGFDVLYMGADVPSASLVDLAERLRPVAVGLSAAESERTGVLVETTTRLRAVGVPVVAGGRMAPAELAPMPGVTVLPSSAGAVDAFGAFDRTCDAEPAEPLDQAVARAHRHTGAIREAIAAHAAALAGREADQIRAWVRRSTDGAS